MVGISQAVLSVDVLISTISGLGLFFTPHIVGDFFFQKQTDGIHWHLIRCIGGQLLASAYVFCRFRNRGAEVKTSCYMLRVINCILGIFLLFNIKSVHEGSVHPSAAKYLIYTCFGTIAIYMILLLANGWKIGGTLYPGNRIGNFLYQIDAIASITIGMAWISHPQWLLHRQVKVPMDETHELCGRLMGSLFVASQVISGHALHWEHQSDRSMAAETRAVCCLFILAGQIWSQIAYKEDWSGGHWSGFLFSPFGQ
uniref:Uncharacterized protein n=1 Tax=Ditylenchus dipsaci TaxID=166011 RepID=A0A915EAJ9_9BILA